MDPQQRFIASTLQGALDADVLTLEGLYKHIPAEILAEYVAPELLWACLTEGMASAGLGFDGSPLTRDEGAAPPPLPSQAPSEPPPEAEAIAEAEVPGEEDDDVDEVSPEHIEESVDFDVTEGDVDELLEAATGVEEIELDGDEVIEDLPPLPVDEALIVEEVNWGDDQEK